MKEILNMTVGQTAIHPVIKRTINNNIPVPTYFTEYKEMQSRMLEKAKRILNTKMNVYIKLGIGRVGLETGLYNIISNDTTVLTIDNGQWGHFGGQLAENMGAKVTFLVGEPGKDIDYNEFGQLLENGNYDIVTMVHNETQTGCLYDIKKVSDIIYDKSPQTLLFVDAISSFGGTEIRFDDWKIDVIVTGSQKCLNAPQGCPLVCYSEKAIDRMNSIKSKTFYFSMALENNPEYLFVRALDDLFTYMLERGLNNIYMEHYTAAKAVREGLKALGLSYMAEEIIASPSTTRIVFPEALQKRINDDRVEKGIDHDIVTKIMKDKYGVCIAEDRIGTMGYYTKRDDVVRTIAALSATLNDLGYSSNVDNAIYAVNNIFGIQ